MAGFKDILAPPKGSVYRVENNIMDTITCEKGEYEDFSFCKASNGEIKAVEDFTNKEEVARVFGLDPQKISLERYERDYTRIKRVVSVGGKIMSIGSMVFGVPLPDFADPIIDIIDEF